MLRTPVHGTRLDILEWLKDPAAHFPPQHHADVLAHGVRVDLVTAKLGVSRRAAGAHLELLAGIGLLRTSRVRRRTYYRRDGCGSPRWRGCSRRAGRRGGAGPDADEREPGRPGAGAWRCARRPARSDPVTTPELS